MSLRALSAIGTLNSFSTGGYICHWGNMEGIDVSRGDMEGIYATGKHGGYICHWGIWRLYMPLGNMEAIYIYIYMPLGNMDGIDATGEHGGCRC